VWRTDGSALRLPLLKLDQYGPDHATHVQDWQLLADTQQGRACLAINRAVRSTGRVGANAFSGGRHAGRRREISFWSADASIGVVPLVDSPARAAQPDLPTGGPTPTPPGDRPVTRRLLMVLASGSLILPILFGVVVAMSGSQGGVQVVAFVGGLVAGFAALVALPLASIFRRGGEFWSGWCSGGPGALFSVVG
jgi:hypothetical protein